MKSMKSSGVFGADMAVFSPHPKAYSTSATVDRLNCWSVWRQCLASTSVLTLQSHVCMVCWMRRRWECLALIALERAKAIAISLPRILVVSPITRLTLYKSNTPYLWCGRAISTTCSPIGNCHLHFCDPTSWGTLGLKAIQQIKASPPVARKQAHIRLWWFRWEKWVDSLLDHLLFAYSRLPGYCQCHRNSMKNRVVSVCRCSQDRYTDYLMLEKRQGSWVWWVAHCKEV